MPEGILWPMGLLAGVDFVSRDSERASGLVGAGLRKCRFPAAPSETTASPPA
jgi:hypothetical protein